MKILVTVTEIAEVEGDFEIDGLDVEESYLEYKLNEWDNYAIEEAVQCAESMDDTEVVTVTIGPERSNDTIRMALAKGADRAIRIWDDDLAVAEFLDARTKARILAGVVENESPDLVLSGVQSGDDAFGATGIALAKRVGFEWGAVVVGLDLHAENQPARIIRELEGGIEELSDVDLPAVFTIQTGINEPRYASLRGIRQAQSKPLETKSLSDLGFGSDVVDSSIHPTSMTVPESGGNVTFWEGVAEETAGKLAAFLREKGVVES